MSRRPLSPHLYLEDDNGCWIWQRALTGNGYGVMSRNGRPCGAHRVFYEQHVGPIPEGMQLDHLCRVPTCVNPDHLEPVTPAENSRRGLVASISATDAAHIRLALAEGAGRMDVAEQFGVSIGLVDHIADRRTWREIQRAEGPLQQRLPRRSRVRRARAERISAMWLTGMTVAAIAAELGWTTNHLDVEMVRIRRDWPALLPYRYPASRRPTTRAAS